jgi:hypothetical protein
LCQALRVGLRTGKVPPPAFLLGCSVLLLAPLACGPHDARQSLASKEHESGLPAVEGDARHMRVRIIDARFEHPRYAVETEGQIRLLLETRGGPYLFEVEGLMGTLYIRADSVTEVTITSAVQADYTMRLETMHRRERVSHTAVLTVRAPAPR